MQKFEKILNTLAPGIIALIVQSTLIVG